MPGQRLIISLFSVIKNLPRYPFHGKMWERNEPIRANRYFILPRMGGCVGACVAGVKVCVGIARGNTHENKVLM